MKTYTIPSDKLFDDLVDIDIDKITPDRSDLDADTVLDAMHAIAKEEIGEDEYPEDLVDYWDDVCLVRIDMSSWLLGSMLAFWGYDPHSMDMMDILRGKTRNAYLASDGYIYMSHGIGYDWIDADLLGGSGDGETKRRFLDSVKITISFGKD